MHRKSYRFSVAILALLCPLTHAQGIERTAAGNNLGFENSLLSSLQQTLQKQSAEITQLRTTLTQLQQLLGVSTSLVSQTLVGSNSSTTSSTALNVTGTSLSLISSTLVSRILPDYCRPGQSVTIGNDGSFLCSDAALAKSYRLVNRKITTADLVAENARKTGPILPCPPNWQLVSLVRNVNVIDDGYFDIGLCEGPPDNQFGIKHQ